jgi:hypothetical protein
MFDNRSGQNEQSLERTFHRCFLPSFTSFGWGVSEEKIKIEKLTNDRRWTTYAMWFQRRRFLKIGQSETRIACGSHVC